MAISKPALIADPERRPTGLAPVPELPWGQHICLFYDTLDDLIDVVADYMFAGLTGNEACLWAVSEPLDEKRALDAIGTAIPDVMAHVDRGALEIVGGAHWYLEHGELNAERVIGLWLSRLERALDRGFEGLRVTGNAFWMQAHLWDSFRGYEMELNGSIRGNHILVLCTYPLESATAADVLDITRAHNVSIARRKGTWEFLESPDQAIARHQINRQRLAIHILSMPFPGREPLTHRERKTLAQIVIGSSNKEVARVLGISPRTVEFHRANIMRKLGARNAAELVQKVFDAIASRDGKPSFGQRFVD